MVILSIVGKLREGLLHFSWNSSLVNVPPSPYADWNCLLSISAYSLESEIRRLSFVLGGLLRVSIFKGCVQVGPVCSLQLALDFSSELFAQDLQFLCALLPHLPEDMVPPFDETANEEWVRSKAYSP